MDDQNKNLILATALSFAVILVWFVLFPPPEPDTPIDGTSAVQTTGSTADTTVATTPSVDAPVAVPTQAPKALAEAPRASIETPRLTGSISLLGGRIDELKLNDYRETTEPDADIVTLLAPVGSEDPYYALFGWAASTGVTPDTSRDLIRNGR